jgi:hypothetical protein
MPFIMAWLKARLGPSVRTWHIEAVFVAGVLCTVSYVSGKGLIEWVGTLAVFFTWLHGSVADRLAEGPAAERSGVECAWKITPYFYTKEALWCVYFTWLGAWSALAGSALFLGYGVWRKAWRSYQEAPPKESRIASQLPP